MISVALRDLESGLKSLIYADKLGSQCNVEYLGTDEDPRRIL